MTERRHITSGGPWEVAAGYSRAYVVGDTCYVSGTTDAGPDGISQHPGDALAQARAIFDIIEAAIAEGGFAMADVVRTRMYIVDPSDAPKLVAAHGERFGDVRPAATLIIVAGLIDPSLRVEIEAEARRG